MKKFKNKKVKPFIIKDSIDKINRNWNEFSISGEFYFESVNFFCKKIKNYDFEMF